MKYPYGKTVFVTGGSSGIGAACAKMFAEKGFTVYAGARSAGRSVQKFESGGEIRPVVIDVCDEGSVKTAVDAIIKETKNIGIVVHCAGMGIAGSAEDTPDDAAHRQMEVNYFGVMRVNRQILPYMRKQKNGLVICIGSVAGIFPIPFQSHYSSSKFAIEAYAKSLRMELSGFGVKVSVIEPGDTHTGFTDARRYELPEGSPYNDICKSAVAKMETDERKGRSPDSVAKVALGIAERINPPVFRVVGFDYKLLVFLRRLLPEGLILFMLRKMYMR
ncbi:MAG: SDR family oxidoreductase [Bacillota bacterium]|nr:SDR family oxidoreductase [Bacillota bacterium]